MNSTKLAHHFAIRLLKSNFEGLKAHILLFLVSMLLAVQSLFAQKLYFSNIPRLNNKAYYNKVIGENAQGIFILRFRDIDMRNGFSVEQYSHNLDYIGAENYNLGKREKLVKIFSTDSGLVLIKSSIFKGKTSYSYIIKGLKQTTPGESVVFYESTTIEKVDKAIEVEYSLNRKYCAVWIEESNKRGDQDFRCFVFSTDGKIVTNTQYHTNYPSEDVSIDQLSVGDSGQSAMIFLLEKSDRKISDAHAEVHYILTTRQNRIHAPIPFGDSKYFIASYDLVYNQFKNNFFIAALYDFKKPKAAHGILEFDFIPGDSIVEPVFSPISRKFVGIVLGAAEADEGKDPENYYIKKIVPRSDGGYLVVAEYFEISQQMETFYLNGVPQISSKSIYNYNDILLFALGNNGTIKWEHEINKMQSSYAGLSYLSSIGIYVCENSVNIIYNDNSNQNNRVIHIALGKDGAIEQKILLNSETEYTAIIPMEGRQIGYNRYVAPLIQNRQLSLLEILNNQK